MTALNTPNAQAGAARRQWLKHTLLSGAGVSVAAALSAPLQAHGGANNGKDETMQGFPDFFSQAPVMRMRDRLAEFLGASEGGVMDYRYVDAVRLAGHSCPTVAGAYLMTVKGLRALYGSDMPERGNIEVLMSNGREEGVTGVIAAVATLLTGAAAETGFPGMGAAGRFSRKNLLSYGHKLEADLALRRRDTGRAVRVKLDASITPWAPEMRELMPRAVSGQASAAELARFAQLWQARVKAMLVDHVDDPRLVQVSEWQVSGWQAPA